MACDQVSVLHVDMLRTTTHAWCSAMGPGDQRSGIGIRGLAMADSFLGVGWMLMLVFSVGGFAGMVLAALLVMAGTGSAAEEQRD
jgi:hypothetical protein